MKKKWGCYCLILRKKIDLFLVMTKNLLKAYTYNITKIVILKNIIINIKNWHLIIFILKLVYILY